jgi:hypothetical protein
MDLKKNELDLDNLNKENKNKNNKQENKSEENIYFYIMTLQADGQRHQIKIFENSNASELAFNFCKTYNLDFPTMKYLKKCIKQIILHFNNTRKNEMIYLLKDNSSIQEVAEEEIITDNSLKKSGTYKKNNSNNININCEENSKIKKNISKESIKSDKKINNSNKNYKENENELVKDKNIIEEDGEIALKDYSIDYCLENESVEVFPPTEHTTKIEQKSSIKNSYSLNQKKNCDLNINNKKINSKNKKLQINNTINYNRINKRQNCLFNLNKAKKEKNKNNDINNNDLKNILIKYKDIKSKEKSRSKTKSKSKDKKFEIEKENYFIKKNNYLQYNKKPKSLEKIKMKVNNKTTIFDNKEISKQIKNNHKIKHEKLLTNMNEIKNKYFSNYYDFFIKTKNFNTLIKNGIGHKYQTSSSINQDSNRSKSISKHKINENMTQKISLINKGKKEKSMFNLNTLNHQKINSNSKLNLNIILKKESYIKEKQRTVFKNKIKPKYHIICNKNNNIFNKTINGQCLTSRTKLKNVNGKELFQESKKVNSNGIRKMVTESLLNIHKLKEPLKDKKKKTIYVNGRIIKGIKINNKSRNNKRKEIYFKNETNIDKSINLQDKDYFESGNNNVNNNINNNIRMKNKRNITDVNLIKKANIRNEYKYNI